MDYETLNQNRYTNTAIDDHYDEGYADGNEGRPADSRLRNDLMYRQGYTKGIKTLMVSIANKQRTYMDPSNGFDWF